MAQNKVKVVGYAQKVFYENGIEYRNFTPDLVGTQLASEGNTPLFSMGNFAVTTNMDPKVSKTFNTSKFSNFVTLSDLDLTVEQTQVLLTNNTEVKLNLDKSNLKNYAQFGSLTEFVRVSLENIITTWPASLLTSNLANKANGDTYTGNTYEDYVYDSLSDTASFKVSTTFIDNKFDINYLLNGTIVDTYNEGNDLRNFTVNYGAYAVLVDDVEYRVLDFTGSTFEVDDYIYFTVKGDVFSAFSGSTTIPYHIKPNKIYEDTFFNSLPDFETYLLNRQITPLYTSTFDYSITTDTGLILKTSEKITWPVTDGYNIDFNTTQYGTYVTKLLDITEIYDSNTSDLMIRFLVAESISDFDTSPVFLDEAHQDTSGQKVNKTLRVYGRNLDEINALISGIAYAHTVTYDKKDNTPDLYLKDLAKVLGWELVSSILENNLLANYVTTAPSPYSGVSVGMTAVEADVELWRRIILNTPWIWKSKGARKSVEFLLRFIGAPQGLIKFNEYIYKANGPVDVDEFIQILELNDLDTDMSLYPIDSDGYPRPLADTNELYYQGNGLWYRETAGSASTVDILTGNNPHVGLYDGGFKYINQFNNLIPGFSAVTLTSETTSTSSNNLFVNYDSGAITDYSGPTYVDVTAEDGTDLDDCIVVTTSIIPDPYPTAIIDECGCTPEGDDDALSICLEGSAEIFASKSTTQTTVCGDIAEPPTEDTDDGIFNFKYLQYNPDGSIFPELRDSIYASYTCCKTVGGIPTNYIDYGNRGNICCLPNSTNCGCFVACKWVANTTPVTIGSDDFLSFTRPDGSMATVTKDGCHCAATTVSTTSTSSSPGEYAELSPYGLTIRLNSTYPDILFNVIYDDNNNTIAVADWQGDTESTVSKLVDSLNNNVSYGTVPSDGYRQPYVDNGGFKNATYTKDIYANGYTIYNIFFSPPVVGTSYNGKKVGIINYTNPTNFNMTYDSYEREWVNGSDAVTSIPSVVTTSPLLVKVSNITNPTSNESGIACKLTPEGITDLAKGTNSEIYKFYKDRSDGVTGCNDTNSTITVAASPTGTKCGPKFLGGDGSPCYKPL